MEKGIINRSARKAIDLGGKVYDSVKNVFNSSGNKAINETTNGSTDNKQTDPKENLHNEPPSNNHSKLYQKQYNFITNIIILIELLLRPQPHSSPPHFSPCLIDLSVFPTSSGIQFFSIFSIFSTFNISNLSNLSIFFKKAAEKRI